MGIFQGGVGLYFYSAVFQGNMALLALVGVFAVFKLQQIAAARSSLWATIQAKVADAYSFSQNPLVTAPLESIESLQSKIEELGQALQGHQSAREGNQSLLLSHLNKLEPLIQQWPLLRRHEEIVRSSLRLPFFVMAIVIFESLVALLFANWIHGRPTFEVVVFALTVSSVLIALWGTSWFVFNALSDKPSRFSWKGSWRTFTSSGVGGR